MKSLASKKDDDLIILGKDIAQRMPQNEDKDEKWFCKPGWTHCSPGTGGGCCHPSHPYCCGNGVHCRPWGPC